MSGDMGIPMQTDKHITEKSYIRLITLSKYNSHTAPLFKKLKLLTIKDMLALQELKLNYIINSHIMNYRLISKIGR